jgi:hypothetical protein
MIRDSLIYTEIQSRSVGYRQTETEHAAALRLQMLQIGNLRDDQTIV